ncbi:MAG: hemolysin family protein [Campylobacteraceae bacterium]|jgi:CBS domain containing-hemolysin-like protein|nr:hemolysin family protein [Campylobacteraceae bacterium]
MLIIAFLLVFLNGFFVLSEFAIVKVRRTRLEELVKNGRANAKLALKMSNSLDTYLSATQLGVTLSSLALGWVGEPAVGRLIEAPILRVLPDNMALVHTISFAVAFTLITLVHVVMGELVPKSIAIAKSEKTSLVIAKPLHLFWIIFYPFIKLFDILAAFFLRRVGIDMSAEHEQGHSDEELKLIVNESLNAGFIDSVEGEIIKNAVDFSDTVAKEVMTPRKDIICLYAEDSYEENIQIVLETKHTRYPYCDDGKDNPLGMIHLRDLLENVFSQNPTKDLSKLVRKLIFVPENMPISDILARMNKEQIHTSLVIDEFGGTAGLLTMEDILEEIMGDISDEHDTKSEDFVKIDDNTYEFDGMIDIESVCEILGYELEDSEEVLTLGGMVFNELGRPPLVGDVIRNGHFEFKVLEVDGNRIQKILSTKVA